MRIRYKAVCWLFIVFCIAFCSGCQNTNSGFTAYAASDQGIFGLAPLFKNFEQKSAAHYLSYQTQGASVSLTFYPFTASLEDMVPQSEMRTYNGREYAYWFSSVCWDGMDENGKWVGGTTDNVRMGMYDGDYLVVFSVSGQTDAVNTYARMEVFLELLEKNTVNGLTLTHEEYSAHFQKDILKCKVVLTPPHVEAYQNTFAREDLFVQNQEGISFLQTSTQRSEDAPNVFAIVFNTDKGALLIQNSVAYVHRNDISEEEITGIDFALAQKVAKQLNVQLQDLPADI